MAIKDAGIFNQSVGVKKDPEEGQIKQADLARLNFATAAGEIDLKYLD